MGTVNVTLGEDARLNLILGQQLENAVTSVVFDFSAWQTAYGSGTLALSVQRPGDDQPYAVTMTTSGTDATWSVTNLDTAYKGVGHIQLTYTVGSAIKKSVIYKFTVYESLGANGEYPSPGQTWQEEIEDELADVKQDLQDLQEEIEGGGSGLTADLKAALDQLAQKVAYIDDDGQDYYDALHNALYPPATLSYITCVYTQTVVVTTSTSLDALRQDLVVTAHYSGGSSQTVTDYVLSGTLTEGTSTITVSYGGKTTTFTVLVSGSVIPSGYTQLEYLRQTPSSTDGTTFINTGKNITSRDSIVRLEVGVMYTHYTIYTDPFLALGVRENVNNSSKYGFNIQALGNRTGYGVFNGSATVSITGENIRNKKYDLVATVSSTSASITDGTASNTESVTARDYTSKPISVGGGITAAETSAGYLWYGRIYYARAYEGDTELFNYVPCRRDSDGVVGMYDLTSQTFKTYYTPDDVAVSAGPSVDEVVSDINIAEEDTFLTSNGTGDKIYCAVTVKYEMDSPTNVVYPAGILPYGDNSLNSTYIQVYDENDSILTYIYEKSGNSDNRWAQAASGTLTEFSQSWEIASNYSSIAFSVDVRYLDDAYMYDKTTGNIWFAGINTPYYGMSNISEANG